MGLIKGITNAARAAILLQDQLNRLSANVAKITEQVEDLQRRTIRLEERENSLLTKAEAAAQSAAQRDLGDIRERLAKIELFISMTARASGQQQLPTRTGAEGNDGQGVIKSD